MKNTLQSQVTFLQNDRFYSFIDDTNLIKLTLIVVESSSSLPAKMIFISPGCIPSSLATNSFTFSTDIRGSKSTFKLLPVFVFMKIGSLLEIFFLPKLNNSNMAWKKSLKILKMKLISKPPEKPLKLFLITIIIASQQTSADESGEEQPENWINSKDEKFVEMNRRLYYALTSRLQF